MINFEFVKEHGKRFVSKHLILLRQKGTEGRLGIIVTKKTGGSVVRSRWKRVLRETFRLELEKLHFTGDHLVIVKSSQKGKPPKTIRSEWRELCQLAQTR